MEGIIFIIAVLLILLVFIIHASRRKLSSSTEREFISGIYNLEALQIPRALTIQEIRFPNHRFSVKTFPEEKEVYSSTFRSKANVFVINKIRTLKLEYHADPSLKYPSLRHNYSYSSGEYLVLGVILSLLTAYLIQRAITDGSTLSYIYACSSALYCIFQFKYYFDVKRHIKRGCKAI